MAGPKKTVDQELVGRKFDFHGVAIAVLVLVDGAGIVGFKDAGTSVEGLP